MRVLDWITLALAVAIGLLGIGLPMVGLSSALVGAALVGVSASLFVAAFLLAARFIDVSHRVVASIWAVPISGALAAYGVAGLAEPPIALRAAGWYENDGGVQLWATFENTDIETCDVSYRWAYVPASGQDESLRAGNHTLMVYPCLGHRKSEKAALYVAQPDAASALVVRLTICRGWQRANEGWYLYQPGESGLTDADGLQRKRLRDAASLNPLFGALAACTDGP